MTEGRHERDGWWRRVERRIKTWAPIITAIGGVIAATAALVAACSGGGHA